MYSEERASSSQAGEKGRTPADGWMNDAQVPGEEYAHRSVNSVFNTREETEDE